MTGVLKPGVRLLERFSFARKFQLVFVLFALPLGFSLWVIGSNYQDRLNSIDNELEGISALQGMAGVQQALIEQRTLLSTLENIAQDAQQHQFASPCILVIGQVATLGTTLSWYGELIDQLSPRAAIEQDADSTLVAA